MALRSTVAAEHSSGADVNRRWLVGAAMAAVMARPLGAAASPSRLDPSRTADLSLIFRKLAYAMDERIGFWWLKGRRFALVDAGLIPFWDMHIGAAFQTRTLSGGQFEVAFLQTSFYSDLATGQLIRTFDNPLTHRTVDIAYPPAVASRLTFDAQGRTDPPTGFLANLARDARIGPAWVQGDDVWVEGNILLSGPPAPGGRAIRVNDLTTYFGSARDILDPDMPMPLAGQMFSDINIWPPWLQMGDQSGDFFSRCYGRKVATFDAMPAFWRQSMLAAFPAVTANFAKALQK
jgi:hypothetical protein